MSILVNRDTKVIVQGITGSAGTFHARGCRDYGTQVIGGVTPGKGGMQVDQIPVFDTVEAAVQATGANATMIFVPAPVAGDAILEAADAGISLIVAITKGDSGFGHGAGQGDFGFLWLGRKAASSGLTGPASSLRVSAK